MIDTTHAPASTLAQASVVASSQFDWRVAPSPLEIAASGFESIGLAQLSDAALMDRVDVKYVMTVTQAVAALRRVGADYRVLEVNGRRLSAYRNLYFDTNNFALFHDYVNRRADRYKVRSREYIDSRTSYFEVKRKTRKQRTLKERVPTATPATRVTDDLGAWLRGVSGLDGAVIEPKLWNTFTRLTLVSKEHGERVTLDVDLAFFTDDASIQLDGVAVAEVKLASMRTPSSFAAELRARGIHPQGFSKYAVGVALLHTGVKTNVLKPAIARIKKLMTGVGRNE